MKRLISQIVLLFTIFLFHFVEAKEKKEALVNSLLRDIKMECYYYSPPVQIVVSSCARDRNFICVGSGWCVDNREVKIKFPSITCRSENNRCPEAELCLLGEGSSYFDPEVMTDMPYKLPNKQPPGKVFDKASN